MKFHAPGLLWLLMGGSLRGRTEGRGPWPRLPKLLHGPPKAFAPRAKPLLRSQKTFPAEPKTYCGSPKTFPARAKAFSFAPKSLVVWGKAYAVRTKTLHTSKTCCGSPVRDLKQPLQLLNSGRNSDKRESVKTGFPGKTAEKWPFQINFMLFPFPSSAVMEWDSSRRKCGDCRCRPHASVLGETGGMSHGSRGVSFGYSPRHPVAEG